MDMQLTWQRSAMAMFWPWCLKGYLVDIRGHPLSIGPRHLPPPHELSSIVECVLSMASTKLYSILCMELPIFDTLRIKLGRKIAERMHSSCRLGCTVGLKTTSPLLLDDEQTPAMSIPATSNAVSPIETSKRHIVIVAEVHRPHARSLCQRRRITLAQPPLF